MGGSLSHLQSLPHWVYRCYDADGVLLYVGVTHNLEQRRKGHSSQSAWFPQMASVRVLGPFVGPDARKRAFAAERRAIDRLRPLHNLNMADAQRRGWEGRRRVMEAAHALGRSCDLARCNTCGGWAGRRAKQGAA